MPHDTMTERVAPGPEMIPADRGLGFPAADGEALLPDRESDRPGYYDVPMLKPPVWKDSVSWYLFLGGLSGGAYVTSRLAERFGGPKFRKLAAVGTTVAAAAALPCAPLLISDLGDPKRFHHMLRVFKPESPMNLGSWTLTAYHGAGAAALAREWLRYREPDAKHHTFLRNAAEGMLVAVADFAGIPLALLLASYTGVLLTGTANPAWVKSRWLPALFSSSAMSSGAAAVQLSLEVLTAAGVEVGVEAARQPLFQLHSAAHLAEVVTLCGYLASPAGRHAPRAGWTLAAIAGSELLMRLPAGRRWRPWLNIASAALGLAGAYHLRSSLIRAGHESANNPRSRH